MRPISLYISAFGPYAGETNIPMDELGNQGLYLITGDTGAGKTTIFDAICFALFGEPSGNNRETSMLRSKYAKPETPTEVELVFTHSGKEYKVKRNPEYMRPNKKGNGETKQTADAELHMPDGQVISKVRDVNAAIIGILGINREQFSQIAMLAQGDFMKLLLADTKTRIEIFRELFKTGYYQKLQIVLEEKRKEVYGEVEDGRKSINQYIQGISVNEDDVLALEVDKARDGSLTTEDILGLISRLIENDTELEAKLSIELDSINKELEVVNGNIGAGTALEKNKAELNDAEETLEKDVPRAEELKNQYEVAKEAFKGKEKLDKEAAAIEAELSAYDALEKLEKDIAEAKNEINSVNKKLADNSELIKKKNDELEKLKSELTELKEAGVNVEKYANDLNAVKEEISDVLELKQESKVVAKGKIALEKAQKRYVEADTEFKSLWHKYEEMDQAYRDGLAGVLAESLKDGDKCPVCGSTTHPEKAHRASEVPTDKELEDAKKVAEASRAAANEAGINAGKVKAESDTVEAEWVKKAKKLLKTDSEDNLVDLLEEAREKAEEKKNELDEKLSAEQSKVERRNELEKLIPETDNIIKTLTKDESTIKERIASLEATLKANSVQQEETKKKLHFDSKKSANAKKMELATASAKLKADYEQADEAAKNIDNKIAGLKAKIDSYKKTIEGAKVIDLESEKAKKQALEEKQSDIIKKTQNVTSRVTTNSQIATNVSKKSEEIADTEKKLQWMKALADTANGKITGKDKIMLETYIQTTYFDRIIDRANLRLMTMTSGQYELKRQGEASSGRAQSGLELGVVDHYNGTERSVKTLSGGESFMASLSLALGLSDEVQSSAGGINIDTMFVDEGFGALDSESLEQAYKALAGLTEGNRLVGIISHVAELKTKIDSKIIVTKEKSGGSRVEIQV